MRLADHLHGGGLFADPTRPTWRLEGTTCEYCGTGQLHLAHPSDPCERPDPARGECEACGAEAGGLCQRIAYGFADCSSCDVPTQVWPDDVVAPAAGRSA